MNRVNFIAILLTSFLAVFAESYFDWPRRWLGAKIDLLPALMVYASLSSGAGTVAVLSLCGGFWFDSLSMNPLGVTVLPLFVTGIIIQLLRDIILRDQPYAQFIVGLAASVAVPIMTWVSLQGLNQTPLTGFGTLWQLLVMGLAGGGLTPVFFRLFDRINHTFDHPHIASTSFRPDRVIERGPFHDAHH